MEIDVRRARAALAQIEHKGEVSRADMLNLAERGVPAYRLVGQALDIMAEQVADRVAARQVGAAEVVAACSEFLSAERKGER